MNPRPRLLGALVCVGLAVCVAAAAEDRPPPHFMQAVFAPELVMRSAREIGLRPEQRKAITQAIQQTQAQTLELEWQMQEAAVDLEREMGQVRIDEKAALAAAERVMSIEGRVKRAHLGLLIQIKNQLDAEQQQKLAAIRDRDGRRP